MNDEQKKKIAFLSQRKLPNGWKVFPSRTRPNLVYYFNPISRESTWEPPFKNYDLEEKTETSSVSSTDSFPIKQEDEGNGDDIFPNEPDEVLLDVIDLCDTASESSENTNTPLQRCRPTYNNSKNIASKVTNSSDNGVGNERMGESDTRGRNTPPLVQHLNVLHKIDLHVNLQTGQSSAQARISRARGDTESNTTNLTNNIGITVKGRVRSVPQHDNSRPRTHFEEHILPTIQRIYSPENAHANVPAAPRQDKTPAASRLKRLREQIANENLSKKPKHSSESSVYPCTSSSNSPTVLNSSRQIQANGTRSVCTYNKPTIAAIPSTSADTSNLPSASKSQMKGSLTNKSNSSSGSSVVFIKEDCKKTRKEKNKKKKSKSSSLDSSVICLSSDTSSTSLPNRESQLNGVAASTVNAGFGLSQRGIDQSSYMLSAQNVSDSPDLPQQDIYQWLNASAASAGPNSLSVSLVAQNKKDNVFRAIDDGDAGNDADSCVMEWESVPHESIARFVTRNRKMMTQVDEWYVILDTNVLLGGCEFIERVKNFNFPNGDNPVIVVPWQVLKELDNQKLGKSQSLASKARRAIKIINAYLMSDYSRVRAQTSWDAGEYVIPLEIPDDRVLQCCRQLQERGNGIVLVSNDTNIRNMAIACGMKAVSEQDALSDMSKLKPEENDHTTSTLLQRGTTIADHAARQLTVASTSREVTPEKPDTLCDIIADFNEILKIVLTKVLESEMMRVFEEKWIKICFRKPPFSLIDVFTCFEKHWIAVFNQVLLFNSDLNIRKLRQFFCKPVTSELTFNQWADIIHVAVDLLVSAKCPSCQEDISRSVQKLEVILTRLESWFFDKNKNHNSLPEPSTSGDKMRESLNEKKKESRQVMAMFSEIWEKCENFCHSAEQYVENPENNQNFPNLNTLFSRLKIFNEQVKKLYRTLFAIEQIRNSGKCHGPECEDIKRLYHTILYFDPSDEEKKVEEEISPEIVFRFVNNAANQKTLEKSISDFAEYASRLRQVTEKVLELSEAQD